MEGRKIFLTPENVRRRTMYGGIKMKSNRGWRNFVGILLVFMVFMSTISGASYGGYGKTLFWSTVYDNSLKRSNLYAPQQEYVAGFSGYAGLAVDPNNKHIYGVSRSEVYRINFDGSGLTRLVDGSSTYYRKIALDLKRGKMYWTHSDGKIWRANLDGSHVEDLLGWEAIVNPFGITVDVSSGKVYWAESATGDIRGKIRRANLDGSNIENLVETIKGRAVGLKLDLVAGKMYWTESYYGEIMRSNLDGSMSEVLVRGTSNPQGLELDLEQGRIYWIELSGNIVRSCNLDGSDIRDILMTENGPEGVALYTPTHHIMPLGLEISGPGSIPENFQEQYTATAHLEDGSSMDVTDYSNWSVTPTLYADISDTGRLMTHDIEDAVTVTITASYTGGGHSVHIEYQVDIRESNILEVPSSYSTIQEAIDSANNGDVVIIEDGTYTGAGNCDIQFNGKAITVKSENGAESCIIDCEGSENEPHSGFIFNNGEGRLSILEGVTIKNAYAPMRRIVNWDTRAGGGIFCERSSPTIRSCIIRENTADYCTFINYAGGAGIYCYKGSSPRIIACVIEENTTYSGGSGIMCVKTSNAIIEKCVIRNNNAVSDFAAAVDCSASSPAITECEITNNSSSGIVGTNGAITDCLIMNNLSGYYGGGLYVCKGPVRNCIISENTAPKNGGASYKCTGPFVNCIISNNHTGGYGGAICLPGAGDYGYPCDLTNCTLIGNTAYRGNAIYLSSVNPPVPHDLVIQNSILRNGHNQIWNNNQSNVNITYSNIEGGYSGEGNISLDPMLGLDGHHLLIGSPCIDAGDPNYVAGPNETDLDGNPRVADGDGDGNSVVDMGAYEYSMPPMTEVAMQFTPQALNPDSQGNWVKAHFVLPEGFGIEDVDTTIPVTLVPFGIQSAYIEVFSKRGRFGESGIEIAFNRSAVCSAARDDGPTDVMVVGLVIGGEYFYGKDRIRIINNDLKYLGVLLSYWLDLDCGQPDWCGGIDLDQNTVVDFVDFALFNGCCIEVVGE